MITTIFSNREKLKMIGIYGIQNIITNEWYIGQSMDIKKRWRHEKSESFNVNSKAFYTKLSKAFRKYGVENFNFSIIEEYSKDNQNRIDIEKWLNDREKYWIKEKDSTFHGYNYTSGGQDIFIPSQDLRMKESEINRGKNIPSLQELIYKVALNGFTSTAKYYKTYKNTVMRWFDIYGMSHYLKDIRFAFIQLFPEKKNFISLDNKPLNIICQYSLTGKFIRAYPYPQYAIKILFPNEHKDASMLNSCLSLKKKNKTAYGYIWKHYDGSNDRDLTEEETKSYQSPYIKKMYEYLNSLKRL